MTLTHRFAERLPQMCLPQKPEAFPDLEVVIFNDDLGARLGLDGQALVDMIREATHAKEPISHAQAYAGHQFGQFVPLLGDGRALLLGEVESHGDDGGSRVDIHLKGSGRTPFSRGGDGQAALGPMLREYLVSEAMHGLGVPTTRSLAVLRTGKRIQRERVVEGALLVRVAKTHLRVGSLHYAALRGKETLSSVMDFAATELSASLGPSSASNATARHDNRYGDFYARLVHAHARLVAKWMRRGFVHGVLNTDNTSLAGETIDYGPCAFMDVFDANACFSSIDRQGRYAYRNQPSIIGWNLARAAEAMIPLLSLEDAQSILGTYSAQFRQAWLEEMAEATGLELSPAVEELLDDLVAILEAIRPERAGITVPTVQPDAKESVADSVGEQPVGNDTPESGVVGADGAVDYHRFLRALSDEHPLKPDYPAELQDWVRRWLDCHPDTASLRGRNPIVIPRNHLIEQALESADDGDLSKVRLLARALADPFSFSDSLHASERAWLDSPPPVREQPFVTYCGT
ncbi:protein adenylyltransferase SelO family protein [Corynebacterium sp. SCR221107]|nr:protein adenylyltransferase SelO family protein [Corynebacterium sp. SCR221107]WBT07902.1 protein adenylyltransferase SelO family protein [Corynebacterium sp. SCR221107]